MSFTPAPQRSRPGVKSASPLVVHHAQLSSSTTHARHHGHPHARHPAQPQHLTHLAHHRREPLPSGVEKQAF
ncbi:MAG: hypothetical protein ABI456_09995 [Ktedonobacteraceae bacterium]